MIKVLHFVSTPAIWSGVMSVIMNYYRHMDRSRIQFDFLCFIPCKNQQESYEREIEELGGRVYYIPKPGCSVGSLKKLKHFLKEKGNDYAWLHNHEVYLSFLLRPLAVQCGIKNFIIHSHATKYSDHRLSAVRNALLCLPIHLMKTRYGKKGYMISRVERIACSNAAGRFLFGNASMKNGKVFVFYNAINIDHYQFHEHMCNLIKKELGVENRYVIGHVGRFVPQKNHDFILQIFLSVMNDWSNCSAHGAQSENMPCPILLLIGDGPSKADVEQKVLELGISSNVIFLGYRADISNFYNIMDIFILPSLYEGLPVSCIEAQANGLTCLISSEITKEVAYTNHVQFLSIKHGPALWKEEIFKASQRNIHNDFSKIPSIQNEAEKLMQLYLTLS